MAELDDRLELVGQYHSLVEFDRARAVLDGAGFETFSENESTLQMRPALGTALGGARLLVPKSEADRARALLGTSQRDALETNYVLRVQRSILSSILALCVAVVMGITVGVRMGEVETGLSVALIGGFVCFLALSQILVPKPKSKRRPGRFPSARSAM